MAELNLKKNEQGEVLQVITTTSTEDVPLSSVEIKRQMDEHQAVIDSLKPQYDAVKAFEDSNETEIVVSLPPV